MSIAVFHLKNKILIINKSDDPLTLACIKYELSEFGFNDRVFDFNENISDKGYFVNPLSHANCTKALIKTLLNKPPKAPPEINKRYQVLGSCLEELLELFLDSENVNLTLHNLLSALNNDNPVFSEKQLNKLSIFKDEDAHMFIKNLFTSISKIPLFDSASNAKTELDLGVLAHNNIPVFLYTLSGSNSRLVNDKLLALYIRNTFSYFNQHPDDLLERKLSKVVHKIEGLNKPTINQTEQPKKISLAAFFS